jgi:hypothetical protein
LLRACHDCEARQGTERGQCFASEAECLQGGEVIVTRKLGRVVLQGDGLVVVRRNAGAIVLNLDRVEALVFEAYLFAGGLVSTLVPRWRCTVGSLPMVVAPASTLFSMSSFATEHRSTMTWPD